MLGKHKCTKSRFLKAGGGIVHLRVPVSPLLYKKAPAQAAVGCTRAAAAPFQELSEEREWNESVRAVLTPTGAVQTNCLAQSFSTCLSSTPLAACTGYSFGTYWFLIITVVQELMVCLTADASLLGSLTSVGPICVLYIICFNSHESQ